MSKTQLRGRRLGVIKAKYCLQKLPGDGAGSPRPSPPRPLPQFLPRFHLTCFLHHFSAIKHSLGWEANEVMSVARWLCVSKERHHMKSILIANSQGCWGLGLAHFTNDLTACFLQKLFLSVNYTVFLLNNNVKAFLAHFLVMINWICFLY